MWRVESDGIPSSARRRPAVDVGVDEVGVHQVGPLGADRADDVARQPRAHVEAAADRPVRDAEPVERLVEAVRVRPGHVEPQEARVDAALAQRGQQRQQMTLRAAHPGQLVEVEDLHRSSRR